MQKRVWTKAHALVIDETTIGEDISDYIDKNDVENLLSIEEVDGKIQGIEEEEINVEI